MYLSFQQLFGVFASAAVHSTAYLERIEQSYYVITYLNSIEPFADLFILSNTIKLNL